MQPSFLESTNNNDRIAYILSEGKLPCVVFFGGFKSDMTGTKAVTLEKFCKEQEQMFVRFDYTGHGQSSGEFKDGTIGQWKKDALALIDKIGAEKYIFAGSSMGAWIAMLCALEFPDKIAGLVGIASAPDFTEKLIWEKLSSAQQAALQKDGVYYAPSCYGEEPYPIMLNLIEEARNHLLLDRDIKLDMPVCLLHGTEDEDVPWQVSTQILEKITSKNAALTLIKGGNHRLSDPSQLNMLCEAVKILCQP
jgi:pimeloyl-ACP methyl ester carboxylesterase